jgi:hypothetical protein
MICVRIYKEESLMIHGRNYDSLYISYNLDNYKIFIYNILKIRYFLKIFILKKSISTDLSKSTCGAELISLDNIRLNTSII